MRPIATVFLLILGLSPLPSRADRIVVRNGSAIKGKAIVDEAHPDQYLVFGEKGKTPVILKKDRVAAIEPEAGPLDGYPGRRRATMEHPSAQADYDLATWCEAQKLNDLATLHHEAAIRRDPAFAPSHLKLGHVLHDGKWLTSTELKQAQGFVLYRGRWITPEEKEQHDTEAAATSEQKSWTRRLAILKAAIEAGPEARSREAEAQVLAIREVAAVPAIVQVLGNDDNPAFRTLAARTLGAIGGPEASAALVGRLLNEATEEVRGATMEQLARSGELNIIPRLVAGLKSKSLAVVNRAAWGLGNLRAVKAVPSLVPALISTEYQVVWVETGGSSYGPGSPNFGYTGGRSIPVLTGPTVGPGVVAYGATSVPASAFNGGVGLGVGSSSRGPIPTYVPIFRKNVEVLNTLVKLTGKDFGYDIPTWRRWLSTAYQPEPVPAKRVPQP